VSVINAIRLVACLGALVALPASLWPDDSPQFTGGVTLVHVDVQVNNGGGNLATGLTQSDFRVFDNGAEQKIVAFGAEEQPLDLVLLFDVSGSMRVAVRQVAEVGREAMGQLRSGDRVAVMTFASDSHLIRPFTDDRSLVERSLLDLERGRFFGNTHIDDGIYEAAGLFFGLRDDDQPGRRHAVLVLTDNHGGGRRKTQAAIDNLWEADATLSGLVTPVHVAAGFRWEEDRTDLHGGIERSVEASGGEMLAAGNIGTTYPMMIRRLRRRYSLYYRLPDGASDSARAVRVELSPDTRRLYTGAVVLARTGYFRAGGGQHGFASRN
jgi:VWFA-related protein